MLTREQHDIYDGCLLYLEQENISPIAGILILLPQKIENIFMNPEDREDTILSSLNSFFSDNEFRKIKDFFVFAIENDLFDLEKTINFSDTFPIENASVHDLIKIFEHTSREEWKRNPKKYVRYYRIVEGEYESQVGFPLGFKGLDENIEYEENLGL